jgi:hypothetical protein
MHASDQIGEPLAHSGTVYFHGWRERSHGVEDVIDIFVLSSVKK